MANGIRTGDPRSFNKGRSSKFREGSRVRQTPEEGRRTYRPKRSRNNNKDKDNSPKTLNDKNQQASSQKFRQLMIYTYMYDSSFGFLFGNKKNLRRYLFMKIIWGVLIFERLCRTKMDILRDMNNDGPIWTEIDR